MSAKTSEIIKGAIIGAFTIATALIWKDVFTAVIQTFVPASERLLSQFVAATVATVLIIVTLKVFLSTEETAEHVIDEIGHIVKGNHPEKKGRE